VEIDPPRPATTRLSAGMALQRSKKYQQGLSMNQNQFAGRRKEKNCVNSNTNPGSQRLLLNLMVTY